jgi:hypothetical protein
VVVVVEAEAVAAEVVAAEAVSSKPVRLLLEEPCAP